jgi:hypothetical protein
MEPTLTGDEAPEEAFKKLMEILQWRVPTREEADQYNALRALLGVEKVLEFYKERGRGRRMVKPIRRGVE